MAEQSNFANSQQVGVSVPLVTRERYAEMVGLPLGVIVGGATKD
jgi:hypothetical protein